MKKIRVARKAIKKCESVFRKHGAAILSGLAIGFGAVAIGTAVKATVEAAHIVEETEVREETHLTPKQIVKATAKCYIPTAASAAASIACLVGANKQHAKNQAALAASATMAVDALKAYQSKTRDLVGEKQEKVIRDAINEERASSLIINDDEFVSTGHGTTRCIDTLFGRGFWSDYEYIRKAINDLNERMNTEMVITLNEFYEELGLNGTEMGDRLGWDINRTGLIRPAFTSRLDDKGRPCLVIGHQTPPQYI